MKEARFTLRPTSRRWSQLFAQDPDCRLLGFTLVASREGEPLGGNNVQARLGAPDQARYRLDRDVALWLRSGWWVSLRNQFAQVPEVATQILGSVHAELSEVTAALTTARGARAEELTHDLFARTFDAEGRNYWR